MHSFGKIFTDTLPRLASNDIGLTFHNLNGFLYELHSAMLSTSFSSEFDRFMRRKCILEGAKDRYKRSERKLGLGSFPQ